MRKLVRRSAQVAPVCRFDVDRWHSMLSTSRNIYKYLYQSINLYKYR